ncbi:hypothetical protein V2H45_22455 [Tumidithrix elongata RA019]|uniref:Transposase n=1 Tax=Tumidithrix elongata BACA0141 TaxID=2716417 RepID=A0AAW9PWV3_9CYAN|nr:hypothetical protein [Tumidithrix elongata RA019]
MKALQSLSKQDNSSTSDRDRPNHHPPHLIASELEQSVLTLKREEIIEMLERQFHSSP